MAGPTRLELATSGVTGRRSNQLNYDPDEIADSDHATVTSRNPAPERPAPLPAAAHATRKRGLVGGTGFEPVTAGV